ncbi:hypothetical protein NTE_00151 [Candidatus Nitrososphaera evergladensis SR1]|jgi:hypothetical protein|uniref:Uncharacterized protein n=1 Tax=Candidatus Nitrososphaera evergladensis SR1 TaxID=1459636 RepID=A0A075MLX0_9ARCH|nr:hypothetical protein NTE_00151 [Candidatus Nitrososphaera evergladensis SR1]
MNFAFASIVLFFSRPRVFRSVDLVVFMSSFMQAIGASARLKLLKRGRGRMDNFRRDPVCLRTPGVAGHNDTIRVIR